jgi:hypothetical protein
MATTLNAATYAAPTTVSRWAGRTFSGLVVAFLALDGGLKALQLATAVDSTTQLGYAASLTVGLGLLELACLALYALPRTAPLGALLLTGYLGGAIATHVRAGSPAFSVIFPAIIGALVWGGLALRDPGLRALLAPAR